MTKEPVINAETVKHLAKLSSLSITPAQAQKLSQQFSATINVVNQLNKLNTQKIEATPQVTNLTNCLRADIIDTGRILNHSQVIKLAPKSFKGFILVPSVFN